MFRPSFLLPLSEKTLAIGSVEGHLWLWTRGQTLQEMQQLEQKHVSQITWMGRLKVNTSLSIF